MKKIQRRDVSRRWRRRGSAMLRTRALIGAGRTPIFAPTSVFLGALLRGLTYLDTADNIRAAGNFWYSQEETCCVRRSCSRSSSAEGPARSRRRPAALPHGWSAALKPTRQRCQVWTKAEFQGATGGRPEERSFEASCRQPKKVRILGTSRNRTCQIFVQNQLLNCCGMYSGST